MFKVQYSMQVSGPPKNTSNPCPTPLFAGSTNTIRVYCKLLPSRHYYYHLNNIIYEIPYFMAEEHDMYSVTGN